MRCEGGVEGASSEEGPLIMPGNGTYIAMTGLGTQLSWPLTDTERHFDDYLFFDYQKS